MILFDFVLTPRTPRGRGERDAVMSFRVGIKEHLAAVLRLTWRVHNFQQCVPFTEQLSLLRLLVELDDTSHDRRETLNTVPSRDHGSLASQLGELE